MHFHRTVSSVLIQSERELSDCRPLLTTHLKHQKTGFAFEIAHLDAARRNDFETGLRANYLELNLKLWSGFLLSFSHSSFFFRHVWFFFFKIKSNLFQQIFYMHASLFAVNTVDCEALSFITNVKICILGLDGLLCPPGSWSFLKPSIVFCF